MNKTVVVTLTDKQYYHKAKRTIIDTRIKGEWAGDIVLITVGFDVSSNFADFYNIIPYRVEHINTDYLSEQYTKYPLKSVSDMRHLTKMTQWDKFSVFDEFFLKWNKVIFFDAGLRIFDKISYLDEIDCTGKILAPDDAALYDSKKRFHLMLELSANPPATNLLFQEYPKDILNERYFLNCIWVYDTSLIKLCDKNQMIETMNKFPICRCNEMTIMNLLFTMKYKVWKPFPEFISNDKRLFGWIENDRDYGPNKTWRDFCFIKYPYTISFDCD